MCGVIYRSRQHWYGNQSPEIDSVKRENKHVWPEVHTCTDYMYVFVSASYNVMLFFQLDWGWVLWLLFFLHLQDLLTDTSSSLNTAVTARKLLDGVSGMAEAITSVGSKPTKMISSWVSDKIAPDYWIPNYKILVRDRACEHYWDIVDIRSLQRSSLISQCLDLKWKPWQLSIFFKKSCSSMFDQ